MAINANNVASYPGALEIVDRRKVFSCGEPEEPITEKCESDADAYISQMSLFYNGELATTVGCERVISYNPLFNSLEATVKCYQIPEDFENEILAILAGFVGAGIGLLAGGMSAFSIFLNKSENLNNTNAI